MSKINLIVDFQQNKKSTKLIYMAYFSLKYKHLINHFEIIHVASNTSLISLFELLLYKFLLLSLYLVAMAISYHLYHANGISW